MIQAAKHRLVDGTFICDGGNDAICHNYPTCECEVWDAETHDKPEGDHANSPHDECWMLPWLNAVTPADTSADNLRDDQIHDGEVLLSWEGEGVVWVYAENQEPCPACRGQKGEEFTCSICHDTGIYPADSIFRIDPLALAAQAGYDYAGAPDGFEPMYATTDMSDEATNFWNGCHSRTKRADRLMDAIFGPEGDAA